jgi:hypothetical protein
VISDSRHDVDEICVLLVYYTVSNGKYLLTFRDKVSVPSSRVKKSSETSLKLLTLEYGTDTLSRNVGKGLPFGAA